MDIPTLEVEAIQSAVAKHGEQVSDELALLHGALMGIGTGDITLG